MKLSKIGEFSFVLACASSFITNIDVKAFCGSVELLYAVDYFEKLMFHRRR